jgi:hypothetical protein
MSTQAPPEVADPLDEPLDEPLEVPLDEPLDEPLDVPLDEPLEVPLDVPVDVLPDALPDEVPDGPPLEAGPWPATSPPQADIERKTIRARDKKERISSLRYMDRAERSGERNRESALARMCHPATLHDETGVRRRLPCAGRGAGHCPPCTVVWWGESRRQILVPIPG